MFLIFFFFLTNGDIMCFIYYNAIFKNFLIFFSFFRSFLCSDLRFKKNSKFKIQCTWISSELYSLIKRRIPCIAWMPSFISPFIITSSPHGLQYELLDQANTVSLTRHYCSRNFSAQGAEQRGQSNSPLQWGDSINL